MLAIDLHSHTRFFHGYRYYGDRYDPYGYRMLALSARMRGLDAVAVTNHDYHRDFPTVAGITPIPGIEISTTDGHVLVVGPDPPGETVPGSLTPAEAVEIAHERGCAAIVPHPFRDSAVRESTAPFDAIEVNGKHPHTHERVRRLAVASDLPITGGSDAHYPFEVGRAYTRVDAAEPTPEAVVTAIREGRIGPEVADGTFDRLIRRGYRLIHREKGSFEDDTLEAAPDPGEPPRPE